MGALDKFLNAMKLNDTDEYYDDYDEEDEELSTSRKPAGASTEAGGAEETSAPAEKPIRKLTPKVSPMRQNKKGMDGMEVCVIKPKSVEDAREITETLLSNRTVVLNLEGLDVDIAQRVIDFTSGSCYAMSGNLQKISHSIFIITPASVDISGDFQELFNSDSSLDVPMN